MSSIRSKESNPIIYLDWAATTPILPAAADDIRNIALSYPGNPSSIHTLGKMASQQLHTQKEQLAALLGDGILPKEITFTGGGSEANSIVYNHFLKKQSSLTVLRSSIEHPIIKGFDTTLQEVGHRVIEVPVTSQGVINLEKFKTALTPETQLVSIMAVHNITGAIQPLKEVVTIVREYQESQNGRPIHIHTDSVQALGKIPFYPKSLGVDSAAFGAHKFRGPRGVGFLWHRKPLQPLSIGGGQEQGIRPGTEDVASITAMVTAAKAALTSVGEEQARLLTLREKLIEGVTQLGGSILSPKESCVPGILYMALPPLPSEVWVRSLSDKGICISAGSACSASQRKKQGPSPMGIDRQLQLSTIRVSFGSESTIDHITRCIGAMEEVMHLLVPKERTCR